MRLFDMYLLHFEPPLGHAGHYLGVARQGNLLRRLGLQKSGKGARLPAAAIAAGCVIVVTRVWIGVAGDRERREKDRGGLWRLCPQCNAALTGRVGE